MSLKVQCQIRFLRNSIFSQVLEPNNTLEKFRKEIQVAAKTIFFFFVNDEELKQRNFILFKVSTLCNI